MSCSGRQSCKHGGHCTLRQQPHQRIRCRITDTDAREPPNWLVHSAAHAGVSPMPNASVAGWVRSRGCMLHRWTQLTVCCTRAVIATMSCGVSDGCKHHLTQVNIRRCMISWRHCRICMKRHNLIRWHLIGLVPSTTSSSAANADRMQGLYRALASSDTAPAPSLSRGAQCREHS